MIVFVTTADTEILALSRVARDLPEGFPALKAVNPTRLPSALGPAELVSGAVMVLVRLLGGHHACPEQISLEQYLSTRWQANRPAVGVLFYRTHWMSGNREFVDALIEAIEGQGCNVLPVFCYSLRGTDGPPAAFRDLVLDAQG